jgi:membrane protein
MIAGVGVVILLLECDEDPGNIELSFNDIWDVQHSRSMVRKFSDYISFVLVATILMMLSSSFWFLFPTHINISTLVSIATPIITWASPYIIIWVLFTLMFMLMPNTKVKFASAVFGGIIAGSLFIGLQFAYHKLSNWYVEV